MTTKEKDIMRAIAQRAHEVAPAGSRVLLFGSRARGDARKDSDWDVLVLLDKERITPEDHDNVSYPIRTLGWDINEMIEPILFTKQWWEEHPYTPFHENVEEDAIVL